VKRERESHTTGTIEADTRPCHMPPLNKADGVAEFRSLLTLLRDAYNDFDQEQSSACRAAIVAEESREGAQRRAEDGGARTGLAAAGMSRRAAQHIRVLKCLCRAFGCDESLLSRSTTAADGNWLLTLHKHVVAAVPSQALLQLYCDREPSADESKMLALFSVGRDAPPTTQHRDRGMLPSIVQALSRLIIVPLQRSVSYAIPDEAALAAVARWAPLVEVGAGTGYWSAVLQSSGVDVVAFDSQPPTHSYNNAFFRTTFTTVQQGDGASIFGPSSDHGASSMSGRAMLIAWPNNPDAVDNPHLIRSQGPESTGPLQPVWDAECLEWYIRAGGSTVCYVGEREQMVQVQKGALPECGASSTRRFQALLTEHFCLRERHAIPCWPYNVDDLTIWTRKAPP
jgi:hypothetical protein